MYMFLLKSVNCIVSVKDLTSEYVSMLIYLSKTNPCIYNITHLKRRAATVFTVDAVNGHFDLMSLAELGVEEAFSLYFP